MKLQKQLLKDEVVSWNGLMFGLFSVLIGVFLIGMPKYTDDYWYMNHYAEWYASQGIRDASEGGNIFSAGIPWDKVVETWLEHIYGDNIRLGNMFVTLFLLLPKWVGSLLVALSWVYSMGCSLKLAGVNFRKSALVAFAIILWGAFVPWADRMGSEVFQFNYFFATAMSLWLLGLLGLGKDNDSRSNPGKGRLTGIFFVALLTGWWHEGFSIPLFVGLLSLVILLKGCRTRTYAVALSGLLLGILILRSVPGTDFKLATSVVLTWSNFKSQLPYTLSYNVAYFSLIVLAVIASLRFGWRKVFNDKIVILALVSGIIPMLISIVTYAESRVMFWTQIISIIVILKLCRRLWNDYWSRYRLNNSLWLIPLVLFTFVHFAVSDYYVFRMRAAQSNSMKAYVANPGKTVFADVILPVDQPLICLRMPDVVFYSSGQVSPSMFFDIQGAEGKFAMIPQELRNVDATSGRQLEGNLSAREYEKRVYLPADVFRKQFETKKFLEIDYGSGYRKVLFCMYDFTSDRDGKEYTYLCIYNSWYSQHFKTIKGLRLVEG